MTSTIWNVSDASSTTIDLSGLRATATAQGGTRSVASASSGKYFFELTMPVWANGNTGIGIANSSAVLSTFSPSANNACLIYRSGNIWLNGSYTGKTLGLTGPGGNTICVAVDADNKLIWFRRARYGSLAATFWNGVSTDDPATATGGISFSSIVGVGAFLFAAFGGGTATEDCLANFGQYLFQEAVPSGFTAGFLTGTTQTTSHNTLSATDQVNAVLLGSRNLAVTFPAAGSGIRSATGYTSQQFYCEVLALSAYSTNVCVGIANASASLSGVAAASSNACVLYCQNSRGDIWLNNASAAVTLGAMGNGACIGIAVDLVHNRIWFRNGPTGNWNGSGTATPATNTGGIDISAIVSGGIYLLLATGGGVAGDTFAPNFGDSPFIGTAPTFVSPTVQLDQQFVEVAGALDTPLVQLGQQSVEVAGGLDTPAIQLGWQVVEVIMDAAALPGTLVSGIGIPGSELFGLPRVAYGPPFFVTVRGIAGSEDFGLPAVGFIEVPVVVPIVPGGGTSDGSAAAAAQGGHWWYQPQTNGQRKRKPPRPIWDMPQQMPKEIEDKPQPIERKPFRLVMEIPTEARSLGDQTALRRPKVTLTLNEKPSSGQRLIAGQWTNDTVSRVRDVSDAVGVLQQLADQMLVIAQQSQEGSE